MNVGVLLSSLPCLLCWILVWLTAEYEILVLKSNALVNTNFSFSFVNPSQCFKQLCGYIF